MSRDMNNQKTDTDYRLDDTVEEVEFQGATLTITSDTDGMVSSREDLSSVTDEKSINLHSSTKMPADFKASPISTPTTPDDVSKNFFAVRVGAFENAVENSKPLLLNVDGKLLGAWLMTEIDHWDTEKERLILLTEHSLLVIKYDFITLMVIDYRRLVLNDFDKVVIGNFTYPQASVVPRVDKFVNIVKGFVWSKFQKHTQPVPTTTSTTVSLGTVRHRLESGIRVMWNKGKPVQMAESWNPWSKNIPFVTFTSHPMVSHSGQEVSYYNVKNFIKMLLQAIEIENDLLSREESCKVEEKPIVIENYLGLAALFHNVNNLGFFKSRGRLRINNSES